MSDSTGTRIEERIVKINSKRLSFPVLHDTGKSTVGTNAREVEKKQLRIAARKLRVGESYRSVPIDVAEVPTAAEEGFANLAYGLGNGY